MRRSRIGIYGAGVALVAGATVLVACDTDDGRELEPPTSYQEWVLQGTSPSTAPTTVAIVPEITVAVPTQPVILSSDSSGGDASLSGAPIDNGIVSGASISESGTAEAHTSDASDSSEGSAETAPEATLPDLGAQGVVFAGPFVSGTELDPGYTCDGVGLTPLLTWTAPPVEPVELAVAVVDEDAPLDGGGDFVHWLVIGLPSDPGTVGGGNPSQLGVEGLNSAGTTGWTPPCPPAGEQHTYRFTLYAVDQATELPADAPPADQLAAIEALSIASVSITATYERPVTSGS